MRFFSFTRVFKFMRAAPYCAAISALLVIATLVAIVTPGPKLGPDFVGGTEIELDFDRSVGAEDIRKALAKEHFESPDVIRVETDKSNRYLVRVHDVSVISDETKRRTEARLCFGDGPATPDCAKTEGPTEVAWSPGGDRIRLRFESPPNLQQLRERLTGVPGLSLAPGADNPAFADARETKVEVLLLGTGEKLRQALVNGLGQQRVGEVLRNEWIGPKAGAQLRNAALMSLTIALVLIMAYVALRFDIRFAPGAVMCLIHDAVIAAGVLMLLGKEFNLGTIAALLTIIGFSVNDTVVIYDRVRENLHLNRGMSFPDIIDLSVSEMLGRTILTSGTAIMSLLAFFFWGTGSLKDFALTLIVGMISGVYSTVYVALPLTHWLDRLLFARVAGKRSRRARQAPARPKMA
ncbi:MAG TPA: protein translocase subunit SecF [Polyangiaceae bacterium]|nr:protein translocase subunit SecF [Polyangiaceae bacterium]